MTVEAACLVAGSALQPGEAGRQIDRGASVGLDLLLK